jgi:hypothetical protein
MMLASVTKPESARRGDWSPENSEAIFTHPTGAHFARQYPPSNRLASAQTDRQQLKATRLHLKIADAHSLQFRHLLTRNTMPQNGVPKERICANK